MFERRPATPVEAVRSGCGSREPSQQQVIVRRPEISEESKLKIEAVPETLPAREGNLDASGKRFAIVVSRFNSFITERLLLSASDGLNRSGVAKKDVDVVRVPGSFEIPVAAKHLAASGRVHAIICIGCILRGETSHYDYVASETARGIQLAQLDTGIPLIFCALTCDTLEQAIDRAGLKGGNKGYESGLAAIEMGHLARKLRGDSGAQSRRAKRKQ